MKIYNYKNFSNEMKDTFWNKILKHFFILTVIYLENNCKINSLNHNFNFVVYNKVLGLVHIFESEPEWSHIYIFTYRNCSAKGF